MRFALWGDSHTREVLDGEIDEIIAAGQLVLFAEAPDGDVVGFAEVSMRHFADSCETRNVGFLEGWWVERAWRRQGVGALLVAAAEKWAQQQGALEFASGCDLGNDVSEQAHKALGFEETHRTVNFRKPLASEAEIRNATPGYRDAS